MDLVSRVASGLDLRNRRRWVTISRQCRLPGVTPREPPSPSPSRSTLAPLCERPGNWAVRGHLDPGTPLLKGNPDWTRVHLRSESGSEGARPGSEARSREAPAVGRALGEGSSSPGPARGEPSREPRRAKAKVSGFPPPAGLERRFRPPAPHRRGF